VPAVPDDQIQYVPDEPYALAEDDHNQLLYVGHLAGGQVSLIDLGDGTRTDKPNLLQTYGNMISPDAAGNRGITSMTIRDDQDRGKCPSNVYFSSRYRPVIDAFVLFTLSGEQSCAPMGDNSDRNIALAPRGDVITTGLSGAETRGVEFVDGGRAFVLQRTPPALVAIDTTATPIPYASIEVCQGPTSLAQQKNGVDGPALFVTCFDSGQVYVIDPMIPRVKAVATIGHGPIATIFDPTDNTRAYVVGFGDNNLSVLNIDTRDPLAYHVMQRIGYPSSVPREVGP